MTIQSRSQTKTHPPITPTRTNLLYRKCVSCDQHTIAGGKCRECQKRRTYRQRYSLNQSELSAVPPIVRRQFGRKLHAKLLINQPGDHYEQEADRIAEQVMRISESGLQRQMDETPRGKPLQTRPYVQGQVADVEGDIEAPPIVHEVLRSPGQPLDLDTKQFMESRFDHDFSRVRVHSDSKAAESAQVINAQAYTVGNHVFFASGQYRPGTANGRHLLAHELAHTVQQANHDYFQTILVQRMAACPLNLNASDPTPSGWKSYNGPACVFHCCYRGILEDRIPSLEDPQNECFYDEYGRLVDENHEHAGCRGTPNQYDSATDWLGHTFEDEGGIWARGWDAFRASRGRDLDETTEPFREMGREFEKLLDWRNWYRLAGVPY